WSLRVCAGYLYSTPRGSAAPPSLDDFDARTAEIAARIEIVLAADAEPLPAAIARYLAFYRIWSIELVPLIAEARASLAPDELGGARPSAVEHVLLAAARGELEEPRVIAQIGMMSPAWDVAVPTLAERPEIIRTAIARARLAIASQPRESAHD